MTIRSVVENPEKIKDGGGVPGITPLSVYIGPVATYSSGALPSKFDLSADFLHVRRPLLLRVLLGLSSYLDNSRLEHGSGRVHRSVKYAFHGGSLPEHVERHQQEQTHLSCETAETREHRQK